MAVMILELLERRAVFLGSVLRDMRLDRSALTEEAGANRLGPRARVLGGMIDDE